MKTKNIIIIASLTIISLILGLFWVIAPAPMKDKVIGLVTSLSAERQCFNYYKDDKQYFTDPDSAYIESSRLLTKESNIDELSKYPVALKYKYFDSVLEIKVLAHNSLGGYVSDYIHCPLIQGEFDKSDQSEYTSDQKINSFLENVDQEHNELCAKAIKSGVHTYDIDKFIKEECIK